MTKYVYKNEELIRLAREGDTAAEEELLLNNYSFCYFIANKYLNNNTGFDKDDLASIAKVGLYKAYKTFDLNKGIKFLTYASKVMTNEVLMSFRKNNKNVITDSLEQALTIDFEGNKLTYMDTIPMEESTFGVDDYVTLEKILQVFNERATDRQKQILKMHFYENKKQRQIADELNLSQSYIARMLLAIRETLKIINEHGHYQKVNILDCKRGKYKKPKKGEK
jgi:RNA polymerase sporulation-specific sigma factor